MDHTKATLPLVLDFLLEQYNRGLGASAIGTYRSALSIYLPKLDGHMVGEHPIVVRFMKGIRNDRPPVPKYTTTWDTDCVINFLKTWDQTTLKNLTLKMTMILALITAQRAQTLSKLKLSEMTMTEDRIIFRIGEALKTRAAGTAVVEIKGFKADRELCAVTLVKQYVVKTADLREDDNLIVSFVKPHRAVHVDTIRRWITNVMSLSGINTELYKPHSTRAASTSKAKDKQVPLAQIMKAAMWSTSSTFAKFYDKTIDKVNDSGTDNSVEFHDAILHVTSDTSVVND